MGLFLKWFTAMKQCLLTVLLRIAEIECPYCGTLLGITFQVSSSILHNTGKVEVEARKNEGNSQIKRIDCSTLIEIDVNGEWRWNFEGELLLRKFC